MLRMEIDALGNQIIRGTSRENSNFALNGIL